MIRFHVCDMLFAKIKITNKTFCFLATLNIKVQPPISKMIYMHVVDCKNAFMIHFLHLVPFVFFQVRLPLYV